MVIFLLQIAAGLVIGVALLIGVIAIALRAGDPPMRTRDSTFDDQTAITSYTPPDDGASV